MTTADVDMLRAEVLQYKRVIQTSRKQKGDGVWAGNVLGLAPSKAQGVRDVGTVTQYRHLVELGVPRDARSMRLTERVLFRLLSRDESPALLFEYLKPAKVNPRLGAWARGLFREGATAALAHAGHIEDPRVRGAAHRMASDISQFLRSDLSERPLVKKGAQYQLDPGAHPPTLFSVAAIAYMPNLRRERAGFVDRLGHYLGQPMPKRPFVIPVGRKSLKPVFHVLGDPVQADAAGNPKDLPFALHWIELLARIGTLHTSPSAQRVLRRLLQDCDDRGVWSPKTLRAIPRSPSKLADFAFPLEVEGRDPEQRKADVTFRLALIAKLLGWQVEYT